MANYNNEVMETVQVNSQQTTNQNIYHCCIQKSASQWLYNIFSDPAMVACSGFKVFIPDINFISDRKNCHKLVDPFPLYHLISPL